jgi:autotransporter-associated beta strand protein
MTGGTLGISNSAVLNLVGAGAKTIVTSTVNNAGTINLGGSANLLFNDSGQISNNGIFNLQSDAGIQYTVGTANTRPVFTNTGIFTGTSTIGITLPIDFVNSGTVEAQSGTLELASRNTFSGGTVFSGGGVIAVSGNSAFTGTMNSTNLVVQSGTSTFGANATWAGNTAWTGGTIQGALAIPAGATLSLTGAGAKTLDGATLTNAGAMTLFGAGNLVLNNGANLTNSGTLDLQSDAGVQHTVGVTPALTNVGILRKSGGTGTSAIGIGNALTFSNPAGASVIVQAGTLQVNGGFPMNNGDHLRRAWDDVFHQPAMRASMVRSLLRS